MPARIPPSACRKNPRLLSCTEVDGIKGIFRFAGLMGLIPGVGLDKPLARALAYSLLLENLREKGRVRDGSSEVYFRGELGNKVKGSSFCDLRLRRLKMQNNRSSKESTMTPPAAPTTIPTRCDLLEPKFDIGLDELLDGKLEDGVELDGTLEDVEEEDVPF